MGGKEIILSHMTTWPRGRKENKEVARVDMKNGVYGGCKDYNTRCTSAEFLSSFLFSPFSALFILYFYFNRCLLEAISARLLRGKRIK